MTYSTVVYNGMALNIVSVTPVKSQKSLKQVVGKSLVETKIIGRTDQQWTLNLNGVVTGTTTANLNTNRSNIEAFDDVDFHTYTDGLHNGTYILEPQSLQFNDDADETGNTIYRYSFTLIQQ